MNQAPVGPENRADRRAVEAQETNPSVKRQEKDFEKSESFLIVKKLSSKRDLNWPGNESGPSGE